MVNIMINTSDWWMEGIYTYVLFFFIKGALCSFVEELNEKRRKIDRHHLQDFMRK